MLHVVIKLEVASRLEAHQSHAYSIKLLDSAHLLISQIDFLFTDMVACADLVPEKRFILTFGLLAVIAHEASCRAQLLVVSGIHFLDVGLLCRDYCAEEAEADLRAG